MRILFRGKRKILILTFTLQLPANYLKRTLMIKLFFHFLTKDSVFQDRCAGESKGFSTEHEVKLSALSGPLSKSQLLAYAEEKRSHDQFKYGDTPLVGRLSEPAKFFECITFYDKKEQDEVVTVNFPRPVKLCIFS